MFLLNERLLRSVVLISSAHPEVRARGAVYSDGLRRRFTDRLSTVCPDPAAVATVFRAMFASMVFRVAYGADFLQPHATDGELVTGLVALSLAHLATKPE